MRIAVVEIKNYARVNEVRIEPAADADIILLGGDNTEGKTSVMNAIEAALLGAGAVLEDPVHHGAKRASIQLTLTGEDGASDLVVRREVDAKTGRTTLEVRDRMGPLKSPQEVLDKIVTRFIDPLKFLRMKAPEQRQSLLDCVDRDGSIARLTAERKAAFDRRTEINREATRVRTQLAAAPVVVPARTISQGALLAERDAIDGRYREVVRLGHEHRAAEATQGRATTAVEEAQRRIDDLRKQMDNAEFAHAKACERRSAAVLATEAARVLATAAVEAYEATDATRKAAVDRELARAAEHNVRVAKDEAAAESRARLVVQEEKVRAEVDAANAEIERIDALKAERLRDAALVLDGLEVVDGGIQYGGVPLESASGAERVRVAVAIAALAQPNLRDVLVRDGSLLDDRSMAALATQAKASGLQVWLERVGKRDPGAIIIEDGRVVPQGDRQS